MHIAIVGAGGTGAYLGALLARAGEEVTLVARGAHLAALREAGLTVKTPTEQFTLPVRATDDCASVGAVDAVLFCVKAYDTDAAAAQMRPLVGPDTVVVSVQNGIDNAERIAAHVGPRPVIGGLMGVVAKIEAPGVVVTSPVVFFRIGELTGRTSDRVERLRAALHRAGIPVEVPPDIRIGLWEKFLFICAFSGVTSLMRAPVGTVLGDADAREFYRRVLEEGASVAAASGVGLSADVVDRWFALTGRNPPDAYGSMYHDLAAGRRMELESLNGTMVRLGREHGVATPMNFAIYAALKPFAGGTPPS